MISETTRALVIVGSRLAEALGITAGDPVQYARLAANIGASQSRLWRAAVSGQSIPPRIYCQTKLPSAFCASRIPLQ